MVIVRENSIVILIFFVFLNRFVSFVEFFVLLEYDLCCMVFIVLVVGDNK